MKILERKKHEPIYIGVGDVLSFDVVEHVDGREVSRKRLNDYTFKNPRVVDTSILFDLDPEEADALGLEHGIGGMIGKEK